MNVTSDAGASRGMEKVLEQKILHVLDLFPKVSPSMLQTCLGSGVPASLWKPVLEGLIASGAVYRYERTVLSPKGRSQLQTIISSQPDTSSNDPKNARS